MLKGLHTVSEKAASALALKLHRKVPPSLGLQHCALVIECAFVHLEMLVIMAFVAPAACNVLIALQALGLNPAIKVTLLMMPEQSPIHRFLDRSSADGTAQLGRG
jgi:hypothetical protein